MRQFARTRTALLAAVVASVTMAWAAPASAVSFTITYDGKSSNDPATGAMASAQFAFTGIDSDTVKLTITLTNTTPSPLTSDLIALYFDLPTNPPPAVTMVADSFFNDNANALNWYYVPGNALQPFGTFDVCAGIDNNPNRAGPQACGNGGGHGLLPGQSDIFGMLLTGRNNDPSDYMSAFISLFEAASSTDNGLQYTCVRFQRVGPNNGTANDSEKRCGATIDEERPPPVPEPGTLALLGFGLLGLGLTRRQKAG